jgi:hypothetical protein
MKSVTQVFVYENLAPVIFSDFITSKTKSVEFYEKVTKSEFVKTGDRVESFESRSNKSLVVNDINRNNTKSSVIDVKYERSCSNSCNSNNSFTVNETVTYEPVVSSTTRTVVAPLLTATEIHERIRNLFLDSFLCLNRKESILDTVDELTKKVFDSWKDFDTIEVRMPSGRHITFDWNNFRFEDSILKPPSPIEWTTTRKTVTFK